jgi:hypothetical protein
MFRRRKDAAREAAVAETASVSADGPSVVWLLEEIDRLQSSSRGRDDPEIRRRLLRLRQDRVLPDGGVMPAQ